GPRGAPGDMDPAEWDALQEELDAKLPIADVLNEPDMATGATDKPPSQKSVTDYVRDHAVTREESQDDRIHHGFFDAEGRASWLTGTIQGLPPEHTRHIITDAVAALLSE